MDVVTEHPLECDPSDFYPAESEKVDVAEDVQKYANFISGSFILLFAPLIIIMPFCSKKLNVLTRKIIAMIVLSDTTKVVFNAIMANRRDDYEAHIQKYRSECTFVTFVQSCAPVWSMLWAFLLILSVWLCLQDRFKTVLGKDEMFIFFHVIAWPLGVLITMIPYMRIHKYKVEIFGNYIASKGCQSNFTFYLRNNGTRCLVEKDGADIILTFYFITVLLIVATNIVFGGVFYRVYQNWKKKQRKIDTQCTRAVGFIVAANNSKNIVMSSIQYSLIGFIYIITYFPIVVYKVYVIYHGPPEHYTNILFFFVIYSFVMGNFTSVMNILFYGFFSKVFRCEVVRLFLLLWAKFKAAKQNLLQRVTNFSLPQRDSLTFSHTSSFTDYYSESD